MALVFAAIVPHSPLLIRGIAKDHHRLSQQTRDSVTSIMSELYARQVDTLVILTPHGAVLQDSITLSVADTLKGNLREFGDPKTQIEAPGAVGFAHRAKEIFEDAEVPVQLQTFEELDYATLVPLTFVTPPLPRVLPIHVGNHPAELLIRFGQALYHACHLRTERVGIIASADFLRRSKPDPENRPAPIERSLSHIITSVDVGAITTIEADANLCGLNPILSLIATLAPLKTRGTIRSFEVVTRVGLLTASYNLDA